MDSRVAVTSTQPVAPSTPLRTTRLGTRMAARVSSHTPRQGPTGAAGGDQPGVRPNKVVRNQRNC